MNDEKRYKRQIILPEIGKTGQQKISNSSVLIVGAGGLGCPALLYLAAAGVGHIGIIDFDKIEETNLQRQILFKTNHIGLNKAKIAAEQLKSLNPNIEIEHFSEELSDKNAEKLFNKFDLIIDASDNFSTKYLINDIAVKSSKPFIYGSILGFKGQVSVFDTKNINSPCYRCLFPSKPNEHIPNCSQSGIIGALAGIVGSMQAMEAIKLIVDNKKLDNLSGKLWIIDTSLIENKILSISKDNNCPVCNINKNDIKINYTSTECKSMKKITILELIKNIDKYTLIDVREQNEWDLGHINGAIHLPLSEISEGHLPNLPKDENIAVYCLAGIRSRQAIKIFKDAGFTNLTNVDGGYEEWVEYTKCLK